MPDKGDEPDVHLDNEGLGNDNIKDKQHTAGTSNLFTVDVKRLESLFSDMQRLIYASGSKRRRAYKNCPSHTYEEVEARLEYLEKETKEGLGEESDHGRRPGSFDRGERSDGRGRRTRSRENRRYTNRDKETRSSRSHDRGSSGTSSSSSRSPENAEKQQAKKRKQRRRVFALAKRVFEFYLPLYCASEIVAKFWGALYHIIEVQPFP